MSSTPGVAAASPSGKSAHVPRLALDWLAHRPDERHRAVSGSLVFVDVSGFTAMSERLGRLGKEGAEEVSRVIGQTFHDLLDVAYAEGGSLLKFGGDALLLLFDRDDHAHRAAVAASGMRARLRALNPVATAAGPVRLGMSAGVATGEVHLFLVGGTHRELLVGGSVVSEAVALEHVAAAGEIALSPGVAAAVPESALATTAAGGCLLAGELAAGRRWPLLAATDVDVDPLVPLALRKALDAGHDDAEHRAATVGFIRFHGLDEVIRDEGAAVAARRLERLVGIVQEHVEQAGVAFLGSDVDEDGGKLIVVAGAPEAVPEPDERLATALRGVLDADPPFAVRSGMHGGRVFAGGIGPPYRRTYTVMGDVVNTAARLMAHAAPGELLTSEGSALRIAGRIDVEAITPFAAKGKAELVGAARIGNVAVVRGGADEQAAAFVGRDDEMARLQVLVDGARRGAGGSVVLEGPAGIGKSRLLAELASANDLHGLDIAGDRGRRSTPYWPLRVALAEGLGISPDVPSRVAVDAISARLDQAGVRVRDVEALAVLFGADASAADGPAWRRRLAADVAEVLGTVFPGPQLLAVDDAHWLDTATADLVTDLARAAVARPWIVVVCRRPEEASSGIAVEDVLPLGLLSPADAALLATSASPVPLLPTTARLVAERSGGHPLFVLELVRSVDRLADPDALPETVEAMVASAVDRLPVADRAVLRRVAVLGPSFALADARAVLAADEAAEVPDDGVFDRLGDFLVVEDGRARFWQTLYYEVAYAALPFRVRRLLHAAAGRLLESQADAPESVAAAVAAHHHAAGDHARTWQWARLAGDAAIRSRAYRDAERAFRMALDASRNVLHEPGDACRAWTGLGDSLRQQGLLAEASVAYARARRLVGTDRGAAARLCLLEGMIKESSASLPAALRWYRRGLALLDDGDLTPAEAVDRVRLLLAAAMVRLTQGRYREAEEMAAGGLRAAEDIDDVPGAAHACNTLALSLVRRGRDAADYGRRALALFEQLGAAPEVAGARNTLGMNARRFGRWDEAVEHYAAAEETLIALGNDLGAAVVSNNMGEVRAEQGRAEDAHRAFDRARATFEAAGHAYEAVAAANVARALTDLGRHEEAAALFDSAVARLRDGRLATYGSEAILRRAEGALARGDLAEAALLLEEPVPDEEESVLRLQRRLRGVLAMERGDDDAVERLEDALHEADAARAEYEAALVRLALAEARRRLGGDPAALRAQALAVLDRLGVVRAPYRDLVATPIPASRAR